MDSILLFASILAPIILALVEAAKQTFGIRSNLIPLTALVIGLFVGFLAYPLTDLALDMRLWAGGLAGLASVGLFESGKQLTGLFKSN